MSEIEDGSFKKTHVFKSESEVKVDQLNNVWYAGDVYVLLGKITVMGTFLPKPNTELSPKLLTIISNLIEEL